MVYDVKSVVLAGHLLLELPGSVTSGNHQEHGEIETDDPVHNFHGLDVVQDLARLRPTEHLYLDEHPIRKVC